MGHKQLSTAWGDCYFEWGGETCRRPKAMGGREDSFQKDWDCTIHCRPGWQGGDRQGRDRMNDP